MWDRQRDPETNILEPNLWFDRFLSYRLAGPTRSLLGCLNDAKVRKGQKRSSYVPGSWRKAAKQWHWKERAEMWDAEQRRKHIAAEEKARAEMLRRHIEESLEWQKCALERLDLEGITSSALALKAWKIAVNEERKARGLPEYLLAIAGMTETELREQYAALVGAITQTGSDGSSDDASEDKAASQAEAKTDTAV